MTGSNPSQMHKLHPDERLRLDHVAVAVGNLEEALKFYREQLGLPVLDVEVVEEQGVRVAKLDLGNTHLELLEPLSPDTPVGKFLAQRGPGIHHICIAVQDIAAELDRLKGGGARLIDEQPKTGAGGARIGFVHPRSTGGVLIELSQPGENH
ncbi:MAG TPA: methylmalonyl-CoA epimerase [Candidatus Obscuribacterales bacterium]